MNRHASALAHIADFVGHAAHEKTGEIGEATATHHDHFGLMLLGIRHNLVGNRAMLGGNLDGVYSGIVGLLECRLIDLFSDVLEMSEVRFNHNGS